MLLVDVTDGRPRSVSSQVLRHAGRQEVEGGPAEEVSGAIDKELQQEQIETQTPPVTQMSTLEVEVRRWRDRAMAAAREAGCSVAALATSPLPVEPRTTKSSRYQFMRARFGLTAAEELACGCHVHVAVDSDEEGVAVIDRIRVWLPVLLAISANSPFWNGLDSGYASYRSQAWARWPSAGPVDLFGSATAYHRLVRQMTASKVLVDDGMVYFDARLGREYPTVEIRSADVCLEVADAVLLAALCRGLVDTAATQWRAGEPAVDVPTALLRLASWQAAREGVEGQLLDPSTYQPVPAGEVLDRLVEHVSLALANNGDDKLVAAGLERLRSRGNGAMRQRATLERTGQLVDVVAQAVRLTAGQGE
jgi:carboxylate-amine ligase